MGLKRVHVELGVLIPTSPHTKKLDHSSTVRATAGGGAELAGDPKLNIFTE